MSPRGGERPGAGRPKRDGNERVRIPATLLAEIDRRAIAADVDRSEMIRRMLGERPAIVAWLRGSADSRAFEAMTGDAIARMFADCVEEGRHLRGGGQ